MRHRPAWLAGLFDYAGLFPPASRTLDDVLASHAAYRAGPDAWLLGRLIVPVGQLAALDRPGAGASLDHDGTTWRVSAIVGPDADGDGAVVEAFNGRQAHQRRTGAIVDTVELRVTVPADVAAARTWATRGFEVFCEAPLDDTLDANLDAIADAGVHAKIRTGGAPGAVPTPDMVAAFLCGCAARGVAAKATAGLHHALTGSHPASPTDHVLSTPALGFVNVVVAAGIAADTARATAGDPGTRAAVSELLAMGDLPFRDDADTVGWQGQAGRDGDRFEGIAAVGRTLLLSIGTCSFEEPVAEARRAGLLP